MTIPVTLVSGFLGSGKTTLIRRILSTAHGQRCAVVVNEFGALGIDGDLIVARESDSSSVVELSNGCICCEIQDDLRQTLLALAERRSPDRRTGKGVIRRLFGRARADAGGGALDHILVEASGAASPGPAVQTFLVDARLADLVHLQSVLTLVHAEHIEGQLASTLEASDQVAYADRIVVNHADRVGAEAARDLADRLHGTNPMAEIRVADHAQVPIEGWVLSRPRESDVAAALLDRARLGERGPATPVHTRGLSSVSLETGDPVDRDALVIWLEFLAKRKGQELMRTKGLLRVRAVGGVQSVEVQGVYQWLHVAEAPGADSRGSGASRLSDHSRLVLIGRDLDEAEIRRGWAAITARG